MGLQKQEKLSMNSNRYIFNKYYSCCFWATHIRNHMKWELKWRKVFCYFLSKVCQVVLNMIGNRIFKWIYWMDNASIHKTLAVKEFWENSKISVVTIPPYLSSLNAAETVIHSIKSKLKSLVGGGRWVLIINSNIYL